LATTIERRDLGVLAPFHYRDFALLWSGLFISNFGTWMQFTALGYVVVQLAPTAQIASIYTGLLGASIAVPVLFLSPFAGVVADRQPRRRTLIATNLTFSCVALALGFLTRSGAAPLWALLALSAIRGCAAAFDAPSRQSWVPLIVPRKLVGSAIGLNGVAFNAPSVIGPPVAGLLIATTGVASSFYINAALTLAVVCAVIFMRPVPASEASEESVWTSIKAGIHFLVNHPVLRWVVVLLILTCLLVRPYAYLLPAYAQHVLHVDARGLGILLGFAGIGAIFGAGLSAVLGSRRRGPAWFISALVMAISTIALGVTTIFAAAAIELFALGFASLSFANNANVLLQTLSPDDMRGRVVSVFSMVVLGLIPTGSLLLGTVAGFGGLEQTLAAAGAIALLAAIVIYVRHPALRNV